MCPSTHRPSRRSDLGCHHYRFRHVSSSDRRDRLSIVLDHGRKHTHTLTHVCGSSIESGRPKNSVNVGPSPPSQGGEVGSFECSCSRSFFLSPSLYPSSSVPNGPSPITPPYLRDGSVHQGSGDYTEGSTGVPPDRPVDVPVRPHVYWVRIGPSQESDQDEAPESLGPSYPRPGPLDLPTRDIPPTQRQYFFHTPTLTAKRPS